MAELKNCPVCGTPARMMVHDGCYSVEPIDPRWISVEERLLERGRFDECLVVTTYGEMYVADWSCDRYGDDWWFYRDGEYDPYVTHWMPLPEPPKEE